MVDCDVLVVGFGCAGAAAAFEAASTGAEVIVLERGSGAGGSSAMSGGEIYLGGGTPIQQACGYTDTVEDMYAFLVAALGPHADEEKIRLYCEGSLEHFGWLVDRGVPFNPSLWDAPTWMPSTEDGLMWMGERGWPYCDLARPAPRGHRPATGSYAGWLLMDKLAAAATGAGAVAHVDTVATGLVRDGDAVVGARARRYGEQMSYRARRGVVVTTGGFVDDEPMLAMHAPHLLGHDKVSDGYDDGSGIRLAQAVGAAVRRMAAHQISLTIVPELIARGMLVNRHGQRFVNEDIYPGLVSGAAFGQSAPLWVIIDEEGFEATPEPDRWGVRPRCVAATLDELEDSTGLPPGSLRATVDTYNAHAERGEDPYFHKGAGWLRPLRPPYAVIDPRDGFTPTDEGMPRPATGFSCFTLGGLHTTVDGEVHDVAGDLIPGLYAAGRASSGMHGEGYISGTSLGDGTFFGRRAGRAAAGRSVTG